MNIGNRKLRTGLTAALLLAGITTAAHGFAPGGMAPFGGGSRGMTLIKGNVLCAGCELTEVRKARPGLPHLYQLTHRQGQVVLQVKTINGSGLWEAPQSPLFAVRAKDEVFRQLTAEENLTKEVEIAGIIRSTRTLDIATVTVSQ